MAAILPASEPQLDELARLMREFTEERDWAQFQDPTSLILALVGEVGEPAELFQWVPADGGVAHFAEPSRRARAKQVAARTRFPVNAARGRAPITD